MYPEEKIEFMEIALDVSKWAELMFGYFVKANRSDEEKVEQLTAFAQELAVLPVDCLNHTQKAKARWIEEAHARPPSIPHFLQMLREFRNHDLNNNTKRIEYDRSSSSSQIASDWDGAMGDEVKRRFLSSFDKSKASPATKWVIRDWMQNNGFSAQRIKLTLGANW